MSEWRTSVTRAVTDGLCRREEDPPGPPEVLADQHDLRSNFSERSIPTICIPLACHTQGPCLSQCLAEIAEVVR
jgi:hypothetical protein